MRCLPLIVLLLLASCAAPPAPADSTPPPNPPTPRVDRSEETDYDLSTITGHLATADELAAAGKRAAAAFALSGARKQLGDDHPRERLYVDLRIAEILGAAGPNLGEARNESRALELIRQVRLEAANDARLIADASISSAIISLGANDFAAGEAAFIEGLARFEAIAAWQRAVDAARMATRAFLKCGQNSRAWQFAKRALATAQSLDKPATQCLAALDCAMLAFRDGDKASGADYLNGAYESALKTKKRRFAAAVIARAVLEFSRIENFKEAARWGAALRQGETWPEQGESGLGPFDYARTTGLYALALAAIEEPQSTVRPALGRGMEACEGALALEELDEIQREELAGLAKKVKSSLLKSGGD